MATQKMQYEFMISLRNAQIQEILRRKPYMKIDEKTKDMPVPLIYDIRTEEEKMLCINMRMRFKLLKLEGGNKMSTNVLQLGVRLRNEADAKVLLVVC